MEAIVLHPKNQEQLEAIKAIAKALKMKFETTVSDSSPYNLDFVDKIKRGDKDLKEGKGRSITLEELDRLCEIIYLPEAEGDLNSPSLSLRIPIKD